jgi:hypothetical protein
MPSAMTSSAELRASTHTARIRSSLAGEGLIVSKGTLQSRCVAWEATPRTRTAGTNTTLIEAMETAFHTTDHRDQTIADNIAATGLPTTHNQIKDINIFFSLLPLSLLFPFIFRLYPWISISRQQALALIALRLLIIVRLPQSDIVLVVY